MLTLLDRYIIYSEMLIKHENANDYHTSVDLGFCHSLKQVWDENKVPNQDRIFTSDLPELQSHRPSVYFSYWFNPYDQAISSCLKSL